MLQNSFSVCPSFLYVETYVLWCLSDSLIVYLSVCLYMMLITSLQWTVCPSSFENKDLLNFIRRRGEGKVGKGCTDFRGKYIWPLKKVCNIEVYVFVIIVGVHNNRIKSAFCSKCLDENRKSSRKHTIICAVKSAGSRIRVFWSNP